MGIAEKVKWINGPLSNDTNLRENYGIEIFMTPRIGDYEKISGNIYIKEKDLVPGLRQEFILTGHLLATKSRTEIQKEILQGIKRICDNLLIDIDCLETFNT